MTDLATVQRPGDHHAPRWTVYTSWRAFGDLAATETTETHSDWRAARHRALRYTCFAGVRYVSVQGPGDVVVADYDRYTNRWREYARSLAAVGVKP